MAYDEALAERVRAWLEEHGGADERAMMGGLCFMLASGHMAVGVLGDGLLVRVGVAGYASAIAEPHVGPMDFTGRSMKGFVIVGGPATRGAALGAWVARGVTFASSLPQKPDPKTKNVVARQCTTTGAARARTTRRR